MVDFGAPYAMDGTVIPAAGLRRQAQRDAGQGSGVARAGDLKITQMPTPGQGVRVAAGDDIIECRAPNRSRESYSTPLFTAQNYLGDEGTGIPGTGSGQTRRDMIIHEILDPDLPRHYTPQAQWPEGATSKLSVVPGVPANARRADQVAALNEVTCYPLAAINWPASTATITNSMIEDLRNLHSPQRDRQTISFSLTTADVERLNSNAANGEVWPNAFTNSNERALIPDWATHVDIKLTMYGVDAPSASTVVVQWVQIAGDPGNPDSGTNIITQRTTLRANPVLGVADRRSIPAALRGTSQRVYPMARMQGSSTPTGNRPNLDAHSSMNVELEYLQLAV